MIGNRILIAPNGVGSLALMHNSYSLTKEAVAPASSLKKVSMQCISQYVSSSPSGIANLTSSFFKIIVQ